MARYRILIVEDDEGFSGNLNQILSSEGYDITVSSTKQEAFESFNKNKIDLVLLDLKLNKDDGIKDVAIKMIDSNPSIPIIVMSSYGTLSRAMEAGKIGIFDFFDKHIELEELLFMIGKALRFSELQQELQQYRNEFYYKYHIVGKSKTMQKIFNIIEQIAPTNSTVLLYGESGVGKELLARAIHRKSSRSQKNWVTVNCGAIPETLIESELFGYTKGAFTGAVNDKKGRFEIAHLGTLFLDEVSELSLQAQVKVLRFLQEHEIEKVGSTKLKKVDIRIIAATNIKLSQAVKSGIFREDLYYRLNVIPVQVPPLRERREDIIPLIEHFMDVNYKNKGYAKRNLTKSAKLYLTNYPWPGNVRELENFVERMMTLSKNELVDLQEIGTFFIEDLDMKSEDSDNHKKLKSVLKSKEREYIVQVLSECKGNRANAAEILGLERSHLYRKIKALNIE